MTTFQATYEAVASLNILDESFFEHLRKAEYERLDIYNQTYLDYTGGNLYGVSQIKKHQELLLNGIFGNPHSTNPSSQHATKLVEAARQKVLDFFNAQDYICVFTQNASAALKIVGESYPFDEKSSYVLLSDNHNSVNGIRIYCHKKGGKTYYVPVQYEDLQIKEDLLLETLTKGASGEQKLFAFPAQSNVSGVKHDLSWIQKAQKLGYDVLLDAAAFVPTSKLDLSVVKPEFVSLSFYKIFGYPTGLGCLLIKKTAFSKLSKPWFAGGTVSFATVLNQMYALHSSHERLEDGTLNYLDIPAIKIGLEYIESIGIDRINKRVKALIETLAKELKALHHDNGRAMIRIFGPESFENRGGNIIIGVFDVNGKRYDNNSLETLANENMISVRSGCFCNPGVDEINYCITTDTLADYFTSRDLNSLDDIINDIKKMRGATRVSVGIATIEKDILKFVDFIRSLRNKSI